MNKIITTNNSNKINVKRIIYKISFFCFLGVLFFVVGCSAVYRCEPCSPIKDNSNTTSWSASDAKRELLNEIYGKKTNSNIVSVNSSSEKHDTKITKSNPTNYINIPPPPPNSPE
jgi:hypothetical protein